MWGVGAEETAAWAAGRGHSSSGERRAPPWVRRARPMWCNPGGARAGRWQGRARRVRRGDRETHGGSLALGRRRRWQPTSSPPWIGRLDSARVPCVKPPRRRPSGPAAGRGVSRAAGRLGDSRGSRASLVASPILASRSNRRATLRPFSGPRPLRETPLPAISTLAAAPSPLAVRRAAVAHPFHCTETLPSSAFVSRIILRKAWQKIEKTAAEPRT